MGNTRETCCLFRIGVKDYRIRNKDMGIRNKELGIKNKEKGNKYQLRVIIGQYGHKSRCLFI